MPDPDSDLIQRLRQRDSAALAEFVESRRRTLLAYIERQLGVALRGKVEPQDLLQETALQALNQLPEADLSARDPFGWLCQLAEQRIIDAHRKLFGAKKRSADREVPLHAPAGGDGQAELIDVLIASLTSPSSAFGRHERQRRLQEALTALPELNREALRLRYIEGLPTKEIARKLGKSDGAVRVLLTRSLAQLQEILGADDAP
jgi:RNA polymerase sigma-70 factor (ECF subfamily)